MADTPDETLFSAGVDVDGGIAELQRLRAQIEQLVAAAMEDFSKLSGPFGQGADATYEYINALNKVKETSYQAGTSISEQIKQVQELAGAYQGATTQLSDYTQKQQLAGFGIKGGMEGPRELADTTTKMGSVFGIGHALSVAGFTTGIPELKDAGALVYMAQGFSQIQVVAQKLNETITTTPGLLSPLVSGFTSLGVPMAGILSVLLPIAVAAAVAYDAFTLLSNFLNEAAQKARTEYELDIKAMDDASRLRAEALSKSSMQIAEERALNDQSMADDQKLYNEKVKQIAELREANAALMYVAPGEDIETAGLGKGLEMQKNQNLIDELQKQSEEILKRLSPKAQRDAELALLEGQVKQRESMEETGATARRFADDEIALAQANAAADKMTVEAVKEKIAALTADFEANRRAIAIIKEADQSTQLSAEQHQKNKEAIDAYTHAMGMDDLQLAHLTDVSLGLAQARENEKAAMEASQKALEDTAKSFTGHIADIANAVIDYQDALQAAVDQMNNQKMNALLKERQAEEQYTIGSLEDTEARLKIATDGGRKETDIKQNTVDKLADIALQEQQKEQDLARDFARNYQDALTKYNDDKAKVIQEQGQAEVQAQLDHAARLKDISTRNLLDDEKAILDRDFRRLYESQRARELAINQENDSEVQRKAKEQQGFQNKLNDLDLNLQQEIRQQQVAAQRKLEDLRLAEQREIVQQQTAEQRKLDALRQSLLQQIEDLNHAEAYKIEILQRNLERELQLYGQQERQRIEIAQRTQETIVANAIKGLTGMVQNVVNPWLNTFNNLFGGGGQTGNTGGGGGRGALPTPYAGGGSFNASQSLTMSEIEPETIRFGTRGYTIGGGAALVFPSQSGQIERGGGDNSKHITFAPVFHMVNKVDEASLMSKMQDLLETTLT